MSFDFKLPDFVALVSFFISFVLWVIPLVSLHYYNLSSLSRGKGDKWKCSICYLHPKVPNCTVKRFGLVLIADYSEHFVFVKTDVASLWLSGLWAMFFLSVLKRASYFKNFFFQKEKEKKNTSSILTPRRKTWRFSHFWLLRLALIRKCPQVIVKL